MRTAPQTRQAHLKAVRPARWRALFGYLSLHRHERHHDLWLVIGLAALMGACYGFFVRPFWSEAVQFGQAWAGLIDCRANDWCHTMLASPPSLQITVPAVLLKLGVGVWPLSLFMSALFAAIAFVGVAAASFIFTRHVLLSLAMTLLMLTYQFGNPYGYLADFPVSYFQLGQTGQYVCLLALALLCCGYVRAAAIVGGILSGVHAVWCLGFVLGAFSITYLLRRKVLRRLVVSFVLVMALVAAFQHFSLAAMPPHPSYTPPHVPMSAEGASAAMKNTDVPFIRPKNEGHNIPLTSAPKPSVAIMAFALPTVAWLLLSISYLYTARRVGILPWRSAAAKHFILMAGMVTLFSIAFKVMEELDPQFTLLAMLDPGYPKQALQMVIHRLFNLSGLMVPMLFLGIIALLLREGRSWFALGALALTFWVALAPWAIVPPTQLFDPAGIRFALPHYYGLFIAVLLGVWVLWAESVIPLHHDEKLRVWAFSLILIVFGGYHALHLAKQARRDHFFRKADVLDGIAKKIRKDKGQLILGAGVVSAGNGFNPQLRTGRAIIPPVVLDVYDAKADRAVHVFCAENYDAPSFKFNANVKPCFEQRTSREWAVIARAIPATGVMVSEDYTLKLPLTAKGGGFKYYRLPKE